MARLALALATAIFCVGQIAAQAQDLEKGYEMGTKAATGVCWYEYLKIKPDKNEKTSKFIDCHRNLNVDNMVKQLEAAGIKRNDFRNIKSNLPQMNAFVAAYAPVQYTKCEDYMKDPEKVFPKDYSEILGDGSGSYPYRGWAHCLVSKIEETHGKEAINAMKEKWSSPSHPWINEIINRENENRANHGSPPMKLNKELSIRAQRWADQLAAKCEEIYPKDHITKDHPDAFYEGKQMGENLARFSIYSPEEDSALESANAWYEEIADYPWPEYKGDGSDPLFYKIGHFTSSIWKGVEQAGYGLARRDGCENTYVVGRYWPGGNTPGKFAENIPPLK